MSTDARATLELSKEGRHFLELLAQCHDTQLAASLVAAGARLVTANASGKENIPCQSALDFTPALLCLKGLSFINPRGKFDLKFSKDALCVQNAKNNVIVPTSVISHVAILDQIPQDTKKRCLLFIVLDRNGPAVMSGKQRLEALMIQTLESDTINTQASTGEVLEGPAAAVLCQALGMCIPNFTNFLAPDPELYKSARGHVAIPAVVKVSHGHLFPLPGALLFAERPALFVSHDEILAVEYRRPQSATFDLVLHIRPPAGKGGAAGDAVQLLEFSQVDRGEMGRLQSYFANSKIKPYDPAAPPRLGPGPAAAPGGGAADAAAMETCDIDVDDEDDDEDDEDDEDFDPAALERMEAGQRPAKRLRTEPSGSVAASNLPGAGPSGSRGGGMAGVQEDGAGGGDDSEAEGASAEGDSSEDDDDDDDGDSYDEEEELADLTDEDDLPADAVRQRVGRGGGAAEGKGGPGRRGFRQASEEEEEDDEEE